MSSESSKSSNRDADFSSLDQESLDDQSGMPSSVDGAAHTECSPAELVKARAEAADNHDKYLRALADFENYKRRALKERSDMIKYQGEKIVTDLLEVLDNLELALKHSSSEPEKLRAGLEMVHKLFVDTLGRWEVRGDVGVGKDFDPNKYEALSKVVVENVKPGTIIDEFKRAYFYKDKLIRVGSVVIADSPKSEDPQSESLAGDEGVRLSEDPLSKGQAAKDQGTQDQAATQHSSSEGSE